ncbi:MAG: hypothetical protein LKF42_08795 [Streptococcaceae bacterium]|jgi:ribosomal protein S27E|nr:hypothetical protein [Streptococcaceae bacterium]MCH4177279.1 hypothetical protein [Streptococcaceae bacterium]
MAELKKMFTLKDRYIRVGGKETGCFIDVLCEKCGTQLIKVYGFDFIETGYGNKGDNFGKKVGYPKNFSPNHPKTFIQCPNCHEKYKESDVFKGVFPDDLDV